MPLCTAHEVRKPRKRKRKAGKRETSFVISADERFDAYAAVAVFDTDADRMRAEAFM